MAGHGVGASVPRTEDHVGTGAVDMPATSQAVWRTLNA